MSDAEHYDSLLSSPVENTGIAGEIELILRGYEPVADGHFKEIGFDLAKDQRTEHGFYWEFEDIADAAKKIAKLLEAA